MNYPQSPYGRTALAVLVSAMVHGAAVAEETTQQTITVTAQPTAAAPTSTSTVLGEQLLQSQVPATSDSASLLLSSPAVNLQGAGGVSGLPSIHGLGDDRLRIKVDGMDLISACGNHMNPPLSYIDPSNVGSATVIAGITPVSLGGDSIGGTILVDSKGPEFASASEGSITGGELGAFFRSNGDVTGANLAAFYATDSVSMRYSASTVVADNYKAGDDFKSAGMAAAGRGWLDADEVGSTMYKSTNQSLSMAMKNANHLVELKVGVQDIPYQGFVNQRMDMTGNDSTQINLRYEGEYDWGLLEARAYNENTRHSMQFHDDKLFWYATPPGVPCIPSGGGGGCAAGMPMDTEGDNTGVALKGTIPLSEGELVRVGTELQQYRFDDWWGPSGRGMWPDTFYSINDGERDRLALFAEWESQLNDQWMTQLGARHETVDMNAGTVQGYNGNYAGDAADFNAADRDKTDNNLDLTALARYTPSANRTFEIGYAQKSRSPNLYERYAWSTHGMAMRMINFAGDGNGYVGNLELEPEVAHTVSATFDWHDGARGKWGLKVTPYFTYVDDYIDAERCSSATTSQTMHTACVDANLTVEEDFVYLQFVNQSAKIVGLDITGHMPLAEKTQYGDFIASAAVNYTRGSNETTGDDLYNMMPLNVKLALNQRTGGWNNGVEFVWVDDKHRVSETRNEMETKDYSLVHLRSSYEADKFRFDVGVENLLDRFYNHPLGGAYTGQGMTMSSTGVSWGTPVPGMGRSVYAGVTYKF